MPTKSLDLQEEDFTLDLELEEELEDGSRIYRMKGVVHAQRGKLPGLPAQLFAPLSFTRAKRAAGEDDDDNGEGEENPFRVSGIASSTSVDWYGTEMDKDALGDMAEQFRSGVSLTPRHNGWFDAVEWDEVIGLTTDAKVERADVDNPADSDEDGFVLSMTADLYEEEEKAQALSRRLGNGQPIGLSIGGWFTDIRFVERDDGADRVIILAVELDHLAVTRSPANPDSMGLQLLRSIGARAIQRSRSAAQAPEDVPVPSQDTEASTVEEPEERSTETTQAPGTTPEPTTQLSQDDPDTAYPVEGKRPENPGEPASERDTPEQDRAVTPPDPHESSEEEMPTADELRAIMNDALAPITSRLDALEGQRSAAPAEAAPAAPAPSTEVVDWEARAKEAEKAKKKAEAERTAMAAKLAFQARGSGRRSVVPDHAFDGMGGHGEGSQFRSLVQLARDEGHQAVAEISSRHAEVLTADRFDGKIGRDTLEQTLRSLTNAAVMDGIITDPRERPAWG